MKNEKSKTEDTKRPKVKGVIRNRVRRAFEQLLKDDNIRGFAKNIADIANYSVGASYQFEIMFAAINEEGKWYEEEKKKANRRV